MDLNNNHSKLFNTIFFYFITAIVSAFLFLLLTNTYYLNVLQSKTEEQYTHKLEYLSGTLHAMFEELHYTTAMFTLTDSVHDVLTSRISYKMDDYTVISDAADAIAKFYRTKQYMHSVFIISEEDDIVISNQGTGRIEEFLNTLTSYSDYPVEYWRTQGYTGKRYSILPPSEMKNNVHNTISTVIPVIQHSADDLVFTDPLIINIKVSFITELLNETKLSDNSIIIYYSDDTIIASSDINQSLDISDAELINLANSSTKKNNNIQKINGKRYLVVVDQNELNHNTVCAITPYSDLLFESFSFLVMPVLIFTVGIIAVTILSFLFSRRIYKPIHNVALHLREHYLPEKDTFINNDLDFLTQNIQLIISDMIKLKEDLSLAIPYVCERYLLSLFDDNEILHEGEVTQFLSQYDFTFPNQYFIVIHSTLHFKEGFFNTHSKTEYNAICQGSLLIANEFFSIIKDRYIFSVAADQVCVILNLSEAYDKSDISSSIMKYHQSLDIDDDMMIVRSGVGQLYEGLNGLKNSYREAIHASAQLSFTTTSMIRTYSPTEIQASSSHYSINEENQMINYLLQGDTVKALDHFNTIISKNIQERIGEASLRELYLQLYNTAIRVINRQQLNIYDLMGNEYINISSHVGDLQIDDLNSYLNKVLTKTMTLTTKNNEAHDISSIKHYLDTHFTEELYLDSLADLFDKTPNYLSKYIKKHLGVSYQTYVSSLRIEKAKELLTTTSNSIVAIATEVGFNSRHPFIRKFKILEGITPTEYRKLHK